MTSVAESVYPRCVSDFRQYLKHSLFRFLIESLPDLIDEYGTVYLEDFEAHLLLLRAAFPSKPWPKWAANGYVALNKAILKEELIFRETGQYSVSTEDIDRVKHDVYDNPEVMNNFYLVGLYCTYFLWPHHYQILNFFRQDFLKAPGPKPRTCAEWGVGHGLLTFEGLSVWSDATAVLTDISKHSLGFSQSLLSAAGLWPRCSAVLGDVLADPPAKVDRLICSELLEHVPDPVALLNQVKKSLNKGGLAYLTGAINAPQPDHMFLFRSAEELLELVRSSGLQVISHLSVCHPNRDKDENAPTVLALVASE